MSGFNAALKALRHPKAVHRPKMVRDPKGESVSIFRVQISRGVWRND